MYKRHENNSNANSHRKEKNIISPVTFCNRLDKIRKEYLLSKIILTNIKEGLQRREESIHNT